MNWRHVLIAVMLIQSGARTVAYAQENHGGEPRSNAASSQRSYPASVSFGKGKAGLIYVDSRGMTLYAIDTRTAGIFRAGKSPGNKLCIERCAATWTALSAAADATPVGDWKVVEGAQGPQWTYKGDLVFTFNADTKPGETAGDGYENVWTVIAFTPPAPQVLSPSGVTPVYAEGDFILADTNGRALYTSNSDRACGKACAKWLPLTAGLVSRPFGDWSVVRDGDRAQWSYRGRPVYISEEGPAPYIPVGGVPLRP